MSNPHIPTGETQKIVMIASGNGLSHDLIAKLVGLDAKDTLYKYYRHELDLGKAQRGDNVTKRLATKIDEGDTASLMFYLKTQLGWRENKEDATLKDLVSIIKRVVVDGTDDSDPQEV
jgi:hypothetical protein